MTDGELRKRRVFANRASGVGFQASGNTDPDRPGFSDGTSLTRWINLHELRCEELFGNSCGTASPSTETAPRRRRHAGSRMRRFPGGGSAIHRFLTAILFAALFLAGCSSARAGDEISVIEVEVPLKEPAWVDGEEAILATARDEPRIARVSAEGGVDYRRFDEELGETITPNSEDPRYAYLPQPESGRVAVLDTATLETVDAFDLDFPPFRTTLDAQSEVLFALSEDGQAVAGMHLEEEEGTFPTTGIGGAELLEAPEKGLYPAFWAAGPDGVSYFEGEPMERLAGVSIAAKDIAADLSVAQRAYVAEEGASGRVVAFEGDPQRYLEGDLVATAERNLEGTVEHLASDELHVFAAMEGKLVAMRRESLEVVQTVEFGEGRESLAGAVPSGVAVGTDKVYITLEGEPYVISVEKP